MSIYPDDIDDAVVAFNACYYCGSVSHVAMNPEDCPANAEPPDPESEIEAIRARLNDVVARPAADGKYYDPVLQAVADRVTLMAEVDRLQALLDGRPRDLSTETAEDEDEEGDEYVARCPACGDVIDFCQGHGPDFGDPVGASILAAHDDGDHSECHPDGCDEAPR